MIETIRRRLASMSRRAGIAALFSLAAAGCSGLSTAAPSFVAVVPARAPIDTFNYDRFGIVTVYRSRGRSHDVVLLVSGDRGWDAAADALAQNLAAKGAIVAGIDLRHYRDQLEAVSAPCVSPAPDFENLSHYLQSKLGLKRYLEPTLVGYAAGATLVYATLAEAPEGLFKGAISIGFCPELESTKALCKTPDMDTSPELDSQGVPRALKLSPARQLPGPWIALQGAHDAVCPLTAAQAFVGAVPGGSLVKLPEATHDYAPEHWLPQLDAAFGQLATIKTDTKQSALPAAVADLPLVLPAAAGIARSGSAPDTAKASSARPTGDWFGILLSGDGGWVGLDKGVSAELARHDIPIVGWDSLKYFWKRRTPEGASHDLNRVIQYYSRAWHRHHVLLIGYSQGADTLPFMVNRLPAATHQLVGFTTLLGISDNALWEFHLATWLGSPAKGVPTAPELEAWTGAPYLCLSGESDADAACTPTIHGTVLKLAGGHHFGGDYTQIADDILSRLPRL